MISSWTASEQFWRASWRLASCVRKNMLTGHGPPRQSGGRGPGPCGAANEFNCYSELVVDADGLVWSPSCQRPRAGGASTIAPVGVDVRVDHGHRLNRRLLGHRAAHAGRE